MFVVAGALALLVPFASAQRQELSEMLRKKRRPRFATGAGGAVSSVDSRKGGAVVPQFVIEQDGPGAGRFSDAEIRVSQKQNPQLPSSDSQCWRTRFWESGFGSGELTAFTISASCEANLT